MNKELKPIDAMKKTNDSKMKVKASSEITEPTSLQCKQATGKPCTVAQSEAQIFEKAMDNNHTGKTASAEVIFNKQADIFAESTSSDKMSILKSNQSHYIIATVGTINNEKNYSIPLLCLAPEYDISRYSEQLTRVRQYITNRLVELNLTKTDETLTKALVPDVGLYYFRREVSDEDLILLTYFIMMTLIFDDFIDNNYKLFENRRNIINQVFQTFIEIMQGKYENIDSIIPIDFPQFISLCTCFFDIRNEFIKRQLDFNAFLSRLKKTFKYYVEDVNNVINCICLSSHEYLELKKVTFFNDSYYGIHFLLENVSLHSFKDYTIFHEFEDCSLRAGRLVMDMFSFHRDIDQGSIYDNYVLIKQVECNCSVEDALTATIKLFNEQIIKMYSLKNIMQQDPTYKDNTELFKAVVIIEKDLQGTIDWSLNVPRYQSKTTISVSRKQLTEASFPLIMQFFENNAKDTSAQNLEGKLFTVDK